MPYEVSSVRFSQSTQIQAASVLHFEEVFSGIPQQRRYLLSISPSTPDIAVQVKGIKKTRRHNETGTRITSSL